MVISITDLITWMGYIIVHTSAQGWRRRSFAWNKPFLMGIIYFYIFPAWYINWHWDFPLCKVWMLSFKAFKDVNSKLPVPFDHKNLKFKDICVWPPCKIKTRQDRQSTHWLNMPISKTISSCGFQVFNKKGNQIKWNMSVGDKQLLFPWMSLNVMIPPFQSQYSHCICFLVRTVGVSVGTGTSSTEMGFRLEIDPYQSYWKEPQLVA